MSVRSRPRTSGCGSRVERARVRISVRTAALASSRNNLCAERGDSGGDRSSRIIGYAGWLHVPMRFSGAT